MSTPAYPIDTLGRPISDGYSLKPADLHSRVETDCGIPFSLNASNGFTTEVSVKWSWSSEQYAAFCAFYRNDLKDGSIAFTAAESLLYNTLGSVTYRFKEPFKATQNGWAHWEVSATLETVDFDVMSESGFTTEWENADAKVPPQIATQPSNVSIYIGNPFSLSVTASSVDPFQVLFGNPTTDTSENPVQSFHRGSTDGFALPQQSRKTPITVTQIPVVWEMDNDAKYIFVGWWHYTLKNGADWFDLYTEFKGVWQTIKVRFIGAITFEYQDVNRWKISGTVETVENNYLAPADCPDLLAPDGHVPTITTQPSDISVAAGSSATFTVVAENDEFSGDTLNYQWYKVVTVTTTTSIVVYITKYYGTQPYQEPLTISNTTTKSTTTKIDGATSASYIIEGVTNSDSANTQYYVIVSNAYGSVQSNNAKIILT